MQYDVIKEVKHASIQELLLTIAYHGISILTTLLARIITLNIFFSAASLNAAFI